VNPTPIIRILVLVMLIFTGMLGLVNGPADMSNPGTLLQRLVPVAVTVYGVTGIWAAVALMRGLRLTLPLVLIWGCAATVAAAVASVAWSGENATWWLGLLTGFGAAAIAWLTYRGAQTVLRAGRS
jgi:hypothetical protein